MNFYNTFSNYYDSIFPLKEDKKQFFKSYFSKTNLNILEVGCATGELSIFMGLSGNNVSALDINEDFIELARNKKKFFCTPISFTILKMQDIIHNYQENYFDLIICVGNTLPHITKEEQIQFINDARLLLKENGKLILQFFNFSILDNENDYIFPDIKNEELIFKRIYTKLNKDEIKFDIQLILSEQDIELKDSNILYPIDLESLIGELDKLGFINKMLYKDFAKNSFEKNNNSVIIELQK